MAGNWHVVMKEAEFPDEGKYACVVAEWHVFIVKTGETYAAVNDRCTHMAASLSPGKVRKGGVFCPLHGARFDLASGRCIGGTYRDLRVFPVQVIDGNIQVELPAHAPAFDDLPNPAV